MKLKILLFALLFSLVSHGAVVEKIALIINDEIITKTDIENYKRKLKKGGLVDEALLSLSDTKEILKSRQALIAHLINEKILDDQVKKLGFEMPFEKVEEEIRKITQQRNISRAQLKAALKQSGVNFEDYQQFIKSSLERQNLIQKEIASRIKISDEDISAYYLANNKNDKNLVFKYKIAHIQFSTDNGGFSAAKSRAEEVLKKLSSGENFETLASKFSEDSNFTDGGLLGSFNSGEMLPAFEKGIIDIKTGGHSTIVTSPAGFHILKLVNKVLIPNPKILKEKQKIHGILYSELFKKRFRNWLDKKKQLAYIRVNK